MTHIVSFFRTNFSVIVQYLQCQLCARAIWCYSVISVGSGCQCDSVWAHIACMFMCETRGKKTLLRREKSLIFVHARVSVCAGSAKKLYLWIEKMLRIGKLGVPASREPYRRFAWEWQALVVVSSSESSITG